MKRVILRLSSILSFLLVKHLTKFKSQDLKSVIKKTAKFLGKHLTEEQISKLLAHLSFESMRTNPYVNYDEITDKLTSIHGVERKTHFMRKGKVGSWREELSPESVGKLDAWIEVNKIPGLWDDC